MAEQHCLGWYFEVENYENDESSFLHIVDDIVDSTYDSLGGNDQHDDDK